MVRAARPDAIVFDFDYPDVHGLQALLDTRQQFAHIPVLMLTEQCYDNLLLWALRARVWDVLVKPVTEECVRQRLALLRAAQSATGLGRTRSNAMPTPAIPAEARLAASNARSRRTEPVRSYVEDHWEGADGPCADGTENHPDSGELSVPEMASVDGP